MARKSPEVQSSVGRRQDSSTSGRVSAAVFDVDVPEWQLPAAVLDMLLKDRSTGRNITWCTHDYERLGAGFGENDEIKVEQIVDREHPVVRPRVVKNADEQRRRSVEKAEVFTPSWVCNAQNNLVDAAWFGTKTAPFNVEKFDAKASRHSWRTTSGKRIARFPKGKTWMDYVLAKRLEVSCGEAPYLTSRYDSVAGTPIPVEERIGFLDRKLRLVGENAKRFGPAYWFDMAKWAVRSVYAFDWQGDNVLLARENLLFTVIEHFNSDFNMDGLFTEKSMLELAEIISWNVWQMDGIKFVVPNTCHPDETRIPRLDGTDDVVTKPCPGCAKHDALKHNGIHCRVKDWELNKPVLFMPPFDFKPIEESEVR